MTTRERLGLALPIAALLLVSCGGIPDSSILRIRLDGALRERDSSSPFDAISGDSGSTVADVVFTIRRAAKDDAIVGLLLDVKQPQLGLAQIQELEAAMAFFRESDKKSFAYVETAGEFAPGDGIFAIAACADEVLLSPPGDINLGGVRMEVPFVKGTLEKFKINAYVDKRHEYKNAPDSLTKRRFDKPQLEALKHVADDLQGDLVAHLAKRRNVSESDVRSWFSASPYSSTEAKEKGLVDEVVYYDEVLKKARELGGRDDPFVSLDTYQASLGSPGGAEMALIYVVGEIGRGTTPKGPFAESNMVGSDTVAQALRDARKAKVKGILLRVDSPGGSYVASDVIRREVELTRTAGIPVVVSMGNAAASGGYLVAVDANHIVAQPSTVTGSIGVFAGILAMRDFLQEWLGVTFDAYEAVEDSGGISWLDPPSPKMKARIAAVLDRIYDEFVQKAATGRGTTKEAIHEVAKGRIWSGRAAVTHGLVDALGGMDVAIEKLRELAGIEEDTVVRLTTYPQPKPLLQMISELFSARISLETELSSPLRLWRRVRRSFGDGLAYSPVGIGI